MAWREHVYERDPQRKLLAPIARYDSIWRRFGSWRNAVERARTWELDRTSADDEGTAHENDGHGSATICRPRWSLSWIRRRGPHTPNCSARCR